MLGRPARAGFFYSFYIALITPADFRFSRSSLRKTERAEAMEMHDKRLRLTPYDSFESLNGSRRCLRFMAPILSLGDDWVVSSARVLALSCHDALRHRDVARYSFFSSRFPRFCV